MLLLDTDDFRAERRGRHLQIALKRPHSVLSTCPVNGGQREDLEFLVNHQSSEGHDDHRQWKLLNELGEIGYHERVCGELTLPPGRTAMLGTAANMQYAALASESDRELSASAFVTAGVKGNASRAGDPARWREDDQGRILPVENGGEPRPGTIHVLLLFNQPLAPSALARVAATLAEAKTAVLQELAVPSLYGSGLATGTGTDGFAVASAHRDPVVPRRFAGAHSKLGEISARAVMQALREALQWQNGLQPSSTRNLFHALGRYGVRESELSAALRRRLEKDEGETLLANGTALWHEPQLAAAAYALAAVLDRVAHGTLPPGSRNEAALNQLALLACAVAHDPSRFPAFRDALAGDWEAGGKSFPETLAQAVALGWNSKWGEA